jgi:hypothetical protein
MRIRYVIAAVVLLAWDTALALVADQWGSGLQFAGLAVGILLVGGIAFPDDFRTGRPTR